MPDPGERVKQEWEVTSGKLHDEGDTLTAGAPFHPTFRQVEGGSLENKARPIPGTGTSTTHTVGADIGIRALPMTDAALDLALEHGLSEEDFEEVDPKGTSGDYLKSQVEAVLEDRG